MFNIEYILHKYNMMNSDTGYENGEVREYITNRTKQQEKKLIVRLSCQTNIKTWRMNVRNF